MERDLNSNIPSSKNYSIKYRILKFYLFKKIKYKSLYSSNDFLNLKKKEEFDFMVVK